MTALRLKVGRRSWPVADFAEASATYERERDASRQGASGFPTGEIVDGAKAIARVSYNGRVWPPTPWTPELRALYNPREVAVWK